jgi:hypothetical protein
MNCISDIEVKSQSLAHAYTKSKNQICCSNYSEISEQMNRGKLVHRSDYQILLFGSKFYLSPSAGNYAKHVFGSPSSFPIFTLLFCSVQS